MHSLGTFILLSLSASSCLLAQATAVNPFQESFSGANAQWTVSTGDGASMVYGSTSPAGFSWETNAAGRAYVPWPVGSGPFTISWRMNFSQLYGLKPSLFGVMVGLTTAIPGSMTPVDASLLIAPTGNQIYVGLRSGEITNFSPRGKDVSGLGTPWMQASSSASIPTNWNWWATLSRDSSNNITFCISNDQTPAGTSSYCPSYPLPVAYQSKDFRYLTVLVAGTSMRGPYEVAGIVHDMFGYSTVSGGLPHTVTSIVPSGGSTTFQGGSTITINGAGYDNTTPYVVVIGEGSNRQTVNATYVSPRQLTATLPAEINAATPYLFQVTRNNIVAELWTGITYSAAVVTGISPHEVLPRPANSADATVQVYGQGFDSTTTVTIGGVPATVTLVSPLQLSVVVPNGTAGQPSILIKGTGGVAATTIYDSSNSATYPPQGKISFGYAPHPYLLFNTSGPDTFNSPTLATLQSAYSLTGPYANYVASFKRNIASPPAPSRACAPNTCWTANQVRNWYDYAWDCLLGNASTSCSAYQLQFAPHLNSVAFTSGLASFPLGSHPSLSTACIMYDAFFPSMTPEQRAQYLQLIDKIAAYFNYIQSTNDFNTVPAGGTYNNRISLANGTAGVCIMAEAFSLASVTGYSVAKPGTSLTYSTLIARIISNLVSSPNSYGNNEWMADGYNVEGSNYMQYGGTFYVLFGRALINANSALGNGLGDQGMFSTNIQFARSGFRTLWNGFWWDTYNDTEPQNYGVPLLADFCGRYTQPDLCWMADTIAGYQATADSGFANQLNFQPSSTGYTGPNLPLAFIGRVASNILGIRPQFIPLPLISVLPAGQVAALNSDGEWTPSVHVGIKGCSAHECGSNQHAHADQASIVLSAAGEPYLIDPGYYRAEANQHSHPSIARSFGASGGKASIDTTVTHEDAGFRCVTVDATNTYASVATVMRRNVCLYSSGSKRMVIVLDDVQPSGLAGTINYWQTGRPLASSASSGGFTLVGLHSQLVATFFGPPSGASNAPGSFRCGQPQISTTVGPSWAFCELQRAGVDFNTVQDAYVASPYQPRITTFAPALESGSGAMTASVNYGSGTLTITLNDGSTATFENASGQWKLSSTSVAGRPNNQ